MEICHSVQSTFRWYHCQLLDHKVRLRKETPCQSYKELKLMPLISLKLKGLLKFNPNLNSLKFDSGFCLISAYVQPRTNNNVIFLIILFFLFCAF